MKSLINLVLLLLSLILSLFEFIVDLIVLAVTAVAWVFFTTTALVGMWLVELFKSRK